LKAFLVFTLFLLILVIASSLVKKKKFNFFDKTHTNLLKGFAILTVFWAHIGSSYDIGGIQWIAAIGVSLFLIASGYGLRYSYKKSGLNNFWKKRFFTVIVPYWFVYLVGAIFTAKVYNIKLVSEIFFFTRANWYIRYILIIYIVYWIIMKLVSRYKLNDGIFYGLLLASFTVWFIVESVYFAKADVPSLLARQMFAFPLGTIFCDYYGKIKLFFTEKKYHFAHILIGIGSFLIFVFSQTSTILNLPYLLSNTIALFTVLPMALTVIWMSIIIQRLFNNYLFSLLGTISYEIFLVQYMSRNLVVEGQQLSLYICFFATILISYCVHYGYKKLVLSKI
jgi:peptidoglycan/LPS O-acetylase OafA/YrhL